MTTLSRFAIHGVAVAVGVSVAVGVAVGVGVLVGVGVGVGKAMVQMVRRFAWSSRHDTPAPWNTMVFRAARELPVGFWIVT
jgi:hypothetical protein